MTSGRPLHVAALVAGLALLAGPARAAEDEDAAAARAAFVRDERRLMLALAGWSAASVASGAALAVTSSKDFPKYLGVQSLAWGAVDGVIATIALVGLASAADEAHPASYWDAKRATARTIFWVNAALDVAYVAVGAAMWAAGGTDAVRGSGAGVVLQGGFLLGLDSAGALSLAPR